MQHTEDNRPLKEQLVVRGLQAALEGMIHPPAGGLLPSVVGATLVVTHQPTTEDVEEGHRIRVMYTSTLTQDTLRETIGELLEGLPLGPAFDGRWRKRPVVIDAFQWTAVEEESLDALALAGDESGIKHWPAWLQEALTGDELCDMPGADPRVTVTTLEGPLAVRPGDWIIRGVKGELYPCKDDIFRVTYEPVTPNE